MSILVVFSDTEVSHGWWSGKIHILSTFFGFHPPYSIKYHFTCTQRSHSGRLSAVGLSDIRVLK